MFDHSYYKIPDNLLSNSNSQYARVCQVKLPTNEILDLESGACIMCVDTVKKRPLL